MAQVSGQTYIAYRYRVYISAQTEAVSESAAEHVLKVLRAFFRVPGGSIQPQRGAWYTEFEAGHVVEVMVPHPATAQDVHLILQDARSYLRKSRFHGGVDLTFFVTKDEVQAMEIF